MSTQHNTKTQDPTNAAGPVAPSELPAVGTQVLAPPAPVAAAPPSDLTGTQTYNESHRDKGAYNGPDRRAARVDRRMMDLGSPTGLERRRGPGLRRTDDRRSAEEGEMTDEQFEFVLAVDTYKRLNSRPFPSWTEVLEVVKQLGYRKVAASTLSLSGAVGRASTQIPNPPAPKSESARGPESEYLPG